MSSSFKINLSRLFIMGIFMMVSTAHAVDDSTENVVVDCLIDEEIFNYLEKQRPESCKDWPYKDSKLSRSSCQECVELIADACRFIQETPMTRDQKDNLDQRCKDLSKE